LSKIAENCVHNIEPRSEHYWTMYTLQRTIDSRTWISAWKFLRPFLILEILTKWQPKTTDTILSANNWHDYLSLCTYGITSLPIYIYIYAFFVYKFLSNFLFDTAHSSYDNSFLHTCKNVRRKRINIIDTSSMHLKLNWRRNWQKACAKKLLGG
jgi:hypothetical protein